jgi:hypothetical protein
LTVLRFLFTARDAKVVAAFLIAGLIMPFAIIPLWWATTRDQPLLNFDTFSWINSLIFLGKRGVFLGWNGPWDWAKILTMWTRALVPNALIYAILGIVVVSVGHGSSRARV